MPQYSIEAGSLDLHGPCSHDFWVLRDQDGKVLSELHGLATDRETGKTVPIGTDEQLHSLRVKHIVRDADYAETLGVKQSRGGYYAEGQDSRTVLTADKKEVMSRCNAAVAAAAPLNAQDRDDPSYGFKVFADTVNSNSTYRTLGEIMGVPVHNFSGAMEPGIDNRMVDEKTIQALRTHDYPVLDAPTVKENGRYRSSGNDTSPDIDRRTGEGLAGTLGQEAARLEQVASATYRVCAGNPLVQRVDYAGVHGGHTVATYAPHGLGREPMFNAAIPLAQAERDSADVHMAKANDALDLARQQTQAAPQQQQGCSPAGRA